MWKWFWGLSTCWVFQKGVHIAVPKIFLFNSIFAEVIQSDKRLLLMDWNHLLEMIPSKLVGNMLIHYVGWKILMARVLQFLHASPTQLETTRWCWTSRFKPCRLTKGKHPPWNEQQKHLKIDDWNTIVPFWGGRPIFSCELSVVGSVCYCFYYLGCWRSLIRLFLPRIMEHARKCHVLRRLATHLLGPWFSTDSHDFGMKTKGLQWPVTFGNTPCENTKMSRKIIPPKKFPRNLAPEKREPSKKRKKINPNHQIVRFQPLVSIGSGLKYVLFSPLFGKDSQFDE